jgi:aspartyl protease family protein
MGRAAFVRMGLAFTVAAALAASPATALTPFAGETVQEFEARKAGRRLEKPEVELGGVVTLLADRRGHFLAEASVDGRRLRMMVDTGASVVALSHEDAASAGFQVAPADFTVPVHTANGATRAAPIRIAEIRIGDIVVRDVPAVVARPGALNVSLLGMTFLKRLGGFEIAQGRLTLR